MAAFGDDSPDEPMRRDRIMNDPYTTEGDSDEGEDAVFEDACAWTLADSIATVAGVGRQRATVVSFAQRLEEAQNTMQLTCEMVQNDSAPASIKRSLHGEMVGDLVGHLAFVRSAVEPGTLSESDTTAALRAHEELQRLINLSFPEDPVHESGGEEGEARAAASETVGVEAATEVWEAENRDREVAPSMAFEAEKQEKPLVPISPVDLFEDASPTPCSHVMPDVSRASEFASGIASFEAAMGCEGKYTARLAEYIGCLHRMDCGELGGVDAGVEEQALAIVAEVNAKYREHMANQRLNQSIEQPPRLEQSAAAAASPSRLGSLFGFLFVRPESKKSLTPSAAASPEASPIEANDEQIAATYAGVESPAEDFEDSML